MCLASVAAAKLGFLSKKFWFDHLLADETVRRKNHTWRMLMKNEFFRREYPRYCGYRLPQIENIRMTSLSTTMARGLGYEPVMPSSSDYEETTMGWLKKLFPLMKAGVISDFKFQKELQANNDERFLIYKKTIRHCYPELVLKIPGPDKDHWLAIKKQPLARGPQERLVFEEGLKSSKIGHIVLLQNDFFGRGVIRENSIQLGDWIAQGKTVAFAGEDAFRQNLMTASYRMNGENISFLELCRRITKAESAREPLEVPKKLHQVLYKAWLKPEKQAA
jgi:hypothetical protein